ncbi:thioredoxin family protein [Halalkalicoccus jeotgali]|uniref:Thiol-disulfide isomerase/thioredoxin n=1 Tax=Halalkalicoccus jeotgali (strain DSM 18796 / CECT 7217 / JCM 14584 / KCTC 4019 / B3) TaxID=795797 RepID=D8J2C5_HALJB|nr:thioredoxin family protein [Halalkalicoccus jeotgali]ADJ14882.1 thiol-disulfide isomerase/thioredoxin [Halalkalicoccus jeotgali B3]ELY39464.1 thiol-disulfide isomerase/thioredoxin [Halalkalicoccus jeotgali B3]
MALQKSDSDLERGDRAPEFELPGTDGKTHSPEEFADREALLVVFTCNHCPYAKAKIEPLNELGREYEKVAVVGINANDAEEYPEDSFDRMKELVADGSIGYDAYLRDESQAVARAYGAVCTPDPFLFRRENGEFRLAYHGRVDDAHDPDAEPSEHDLREAIEQLLAGEAVSVEERPSRGCSIKWRDVA